MPNRKPPPVPEAEAVLALFRAADRLRRHFVQILTAHDLTLPQYNVLRILRGAGEALPTMEIRDRMMECAPGITRIVDGLVGKGLVDREHPDRDRRQVLCRLTREGRDLVDRLDAPMDVADRSAFNELGAARLRTLVRELRIVESNLTDG